MASEISARAEACLMGILLSGSTSPATAFRRVTPSQISHPTLRSLYEVARALHEDDQPVEFLSVGRKWEIQHQKRFPLETAELAIEGRTDPSQTAFPYSCLWLDHYCDMVIAGHDLRVLQDTACGLVSETSEPHAHAGTLIDAATARLAGLRADPDAEVGSIAEGLTDAGDDLLADVKSARFNFGFENLDQVIHPSVFPGAFVVVGARPSMGKTVFGTNVALQCALSKSPALFVSLEVTKRKVQQSLLLAASGGTRDQLQQNNALYLEGLTILETCRDTLHVVSLENQKNKGSFTPTDLRALVRKYKKSHGLKLVVVDYIQLMRYHEKCENRQQEVTRISAELKQIALTEEVVVVALAQLSRQTESRDSHKPRLSDLRESGAIEQDADLVLMLYRESYYGKTANPRSDTLEVIVAKNRFGDTGVVRLEFDRPAARLRAGLPVHGAWRAQRDAAPPNTDPFDSGPEAPPF